MLRHGNVGDLHNECLDVVKVTKWVEGQNGCWLTTKLKNPRCDGASEFAVVKCLLVDECFDLVLTGKLGEPLDIFDAFWNRGALASETASSMEAKSENKNTVDFNLVITGFVGIKRKQPETKIEFIGVINPSWEQWLNLQWKMSRRFQTLMSMLPNKFIISESYLTFTFYILAVVVHVIYSKFHGGKIRKQKLSRFQFSHNRFRWNQKEAARDTNQIHRSYPSIMGTMVKFTVEDEPKIPNIDVDASKQIYYLRIIPHIHLLHPCRRRTCPHCCQRLHHQHHHYWKLSYSEIIKGKLPKENKKSA
ncbi:hypothetical protein YC2023_023849 [Brassica napus]